MTRTARPLSKAAVTKARSSFAWWCRETREAFPRLDSHRVEDVASRAWCAWLRADHRAPLDLMPRRVVVDAARCEFGRTFQRFRRTDSLDARAFGIAAPQASDAVSSELLDDVFSHARKSKNSRRLRRLLVHLLRGGQQKDFAVAEKVTRFRISQLFGDLSEIVTRWRAAQRRN